MLKPTDQKTYSDYDLKVLRYHAGYPDTGIISGAAFNQATEFLIKSNYITASNHALTPKATALLNGGSDIENIAVDGSKHERPLTLPQWQDIVGRWAIGTFGPTPPAVHAARMSREMADVMDCVAIGDVDNLGRALAGVMVVGLALAESQNINLTQALIAEHSENASSQWVQDGWGQWVRRGDGSIADESRAEQIAFYVLSDVIPPQIGAQLLRLDGAGLSQAIDYLIAFGGCDDSDFQNKGVQDLTPRARGINLKLPKFYPLKRPSIVTGPAEMIDGLWAPNPEPKERHHAKP